MGRHADIVTGPVTVIGITGPSASGKTTLARELASHLPAAVHLQQDFYFRDPDDCPPDANFCDHRWLHLDQFLAAFRALAAGHCVSVPDMDFATFRPWGRRLLGPARHLIVEGMTILRIPEIRRRCQCGVYLDPGFDTIAARKRERDRLERNKPEWVIEVQLAWMREERTADRSLRDDPRVIAKS